jgi:prolyl-tRNA editing enzyme YbaK/EbsC (Cys-tRNA(Pro) deacylase)
MSTVLPAVAAALARYKLNYEVLACDPTLADTAVFCEAYGFSLNDAANTIIVAGKASPPMFGACLALATTRLDGNGKVCEVLGVKKASFATAEQIVSLSGMEIGGVTLIGLENLPIYIDSAVMQRSRIVVGGGNRSSKVVLAPQELLKLPNVQIVEGLARPKP